MPRFAVVSSKDLFDKMKNPIMCMSAKRGCQICDECEHWKKFAKKNKLMSPDEIIQNMTCKPQVTTERIEILSRMFNVNLKIRNITEQNNEDKKKLQSL